jgi:hypothetical protein
MKAIEIGNAMINSSDKRRMTDDEANVLVGIFGMKDDFFTKHLDGEKLPAAFMIAKKRCEWAGVPVENSPGEIVLYCAALKAISEKNGRRGNFRKERQAGRPR